MALRSAGRRERGSVEGALRQTLDACSGQARARGSHGDHASSGDWPQRPACEAVSSYAITQLIHASRFAQMGATEDPAIRLHAVADDSALAMGACWRESVDGAFEAVEDMSCPPARTSNALP